MAEILTPAQILVLAEQIKELLAKDSQGVGEIPVVASLDNILSLPALQVIGSDEKVVEAPLSLLRVSLRKAATAIEWRQGDTGMWQTLVSIPDITGPKGETPVFRTGENGIEWKYESEPDTAWRLLVSIDVLKLTFDMLTEAQKEAIRGYSAYQLWEQEEGNNGKTYPDFKDWMKKEALEAAEIANKATEETIVVKQDTQLVKKETETIQIVSDKTRIKTETVKADTLHVKKETVVVQAVTDDTRIRTEAVKADTVHVKTETKAIQIATDKTRIKTETVKTDILYVKKETETVQAATDEARIKTETVKVDTLHVKEETEAIQTVIDKTRIETEAIKTETLHVKEETEAVQAATDKTRIETLTVKHDTLRAKNETITVTDVAKELNAHPGKPVGGYWFFWNLEKKDYVNSGIQAKGDVGSSFKIVGRYDTLDELKIAVPDGTNVDGVYAIGAVEPFSYYAWLVIDGVWQWDDQGKLRGAEGKSSFEVWTERPENAGKTEEQYFDWLSPLIDPVTGRWKVQDDDTGVQALGINAEVTEKENKPDSYILHVKSAKGEFNTPNLRGFDVKVVEDEANTSDSYKLKITTVAGEFTTPNLQGRSGSAVIDINHEPTVVDTHYTYNGVQYAYNVGDEVRWYDVDSEVYVLFKCYAITDAGAVWEELGSGGVSLPVDMFLDSPSDLSADEAGSYIFLVDGYLKGKEE